MRYPDKEQKPFTDPCWTADDLQAYTGPVFRACVSWWSRVTNARQASDHEAPSMVVLHEQVNQQVRALRARGTNPAVSFGPHTEPERSPA